MKLKRYLAVVCYSIVFYANAAYPELVSLKTQAQLYKDNPDASVRDEIIKLYNEIVAKYKLQGAVQNSLVRILRENRLDIDDLKKEQAEDREEAVTANAKKAEQQRIGVQVKKLVDKNKSEQDSLKSELKECREEKFALEEEITELKEKLSQNS